MNKDALREELLNGDAVLPADRVILVARRRLVEHFAVLNDDRLRRGRRSRVGRLHDVWNVGPSSSGTQLSSRPGSGTVSMTQYSCPSCSSEYCTLGLGHGILKGRCLSL